MLVAKFPSHLQKVTCVGANMTFGAAMATRWNVMALIIQTLIAKHVLVVQQGNVVGMKAGMVIAMHMICKPTRRLRTCVNFNHWWIYWNTNIIFKQISKTYNIRVLGNQMNFHKFFVKDKRLTQLTKIKWVQGQIEKILRL